MRTLIAGQITAIRASHTTHVWFIQLGFSTPQYLSTAGHSLTWDGHTWAGAASLLNITQIEETDGIESSGYTLSTPATAPANVALALQDADTIRGDSVYVWEAWFGAGGSMIGSPVMVDQGLMDAPEIVDERVSLPVESELADFLRPRIRRQTDADQQQQYPGDLFYSMVAQMAEKAVAFPSMEWQRQ